MSQRCEGPPTPFITLSRTPALDLGNLPGALSPGGLWSPARSSCLSTWYRPCLFPTRPSHHLLSCLLSPDSGIPGIHSRSRVVCFPCLLRSIKLTLNLRLLRSRDPAWQISWCFCHILLERQGSLPTCGGSAGVTTGDQKVINTEDRQVASLFCISPSIGKVVPPHSSPFGHLI